MRVNERASERATEMNRDGRKVNHTHRGNITGDRDGMKLRVCCVCLFAEPEN